MLNFKKEWAEIMMAADENHCVEAVVMEISNRYGTVRFHNGLLLSIEVEYIACGRIFNRSECGSGSSTGRVFSEVCKRKCI